MINSDLSDGHSTPSAIGSVTPFAPISLNLHDDDICTDLKGGSISSYRTTPNEVIYPYSLNDGGDASDLDLIFDQYLRSPSLSPSPSPSSSFRDIASELSGVTLIEPKHNDGASSVELSKKPSRTEFCPRFLEHAPEKQPAERQADPDHPKSGPCIRLRVSRPRITLRLKLPTTSIAGAKEKRRENGQTIKRAAQRGSQRGKGKGKVKRGTKNEKVRKGKR